MKYKKLSKVSHKVTQHQKKCLMKTQKKSLKVTEASMIKQENNKITK